MIIQPAPAAPSYWTPIVDDAYETLYIETGNNVHVAGEGAFVEIEDKIIRSIKEGETAQLQFTREVEEGEREPLPWLACGDVQLAGGVVRRTAVNGEAFIQGERPVLGFVKDPMTSLPAGTEVKAGIRLNAGSEKALDVIGEKVLPAEHQKAVLGEKEKQWKEVWTKGGYVETELLPAETDTAVLGSDAKRWKQAVVKELKAETITTPVATADKKGVVSIVVSGTGNTVTEAKLGDGVLTLTKSNTVVNVTSSGSGPVIVGYSYSNGTLTLRYGTLTCSQAGCYSSCNSCCSCPSCDSCCACSDIYNVCVRCGCNNGDEECKEKKASGECEAEKVEKKATAEAAAAKEKAYHDARQCKGHPEHQQHVEEINSKPLPQVKKNPAKSKKGCPDAGGDANILFQVMQKEVAALRDMVREQGQRILGLERQNAVLREQVEKELESK
jgi:hypothetical protein